MSSPHWQFVTPSSPFLSSLFSKVYVVNCLWGYHFSPPPYRDDIVYAWPLDRYIAMKFYPKTQNRLVNLKTVHTLRITKLKECSIIFFLLWSDKISASDYSVIQLGDTAESSFLPHMPPCHHRWFFFKTRYNVYHV